jgi:hypothetical protein
LEMKFCARADQEVPTGLLLGMVHLQTVPAALQALGEAREVMALRDAAVEDSPAAQEVPAVLEVLAVEVGTAAEARRTT